MAAYIVNAVTFAVLNLLLNVLFVWVYSQVRIRRSLKQDMMISTALSTASDTPWIAPPACSSPPSSAPRAPSARAASPARRAPSLGEAPAAAPGPCMSWHRPPRDTRMPRVGFQFSRSTLSRRLTPQRGLSMRRRGLPTHPLCTSLHPVRRTTLPAHTPPCSQAEQCQQTGCMHPRTCSSSAQILLALFAASLCDLSCHWQCHDWEWHDDAIVPTWIIPLAT